MSRLVSKNVQALKGRTSMRMEPEFWTALNEIACATLDGSVNTVIQFVESGKKPGDGLTSAVRVHILTWFRSKGGML